MKDDKILIECKEYILQEYLYLYKALIKAQNIYIFEYNFDITTVVSTSTLSLKIFRSKFQDKDLEIPILKRSENDFIRRSYLG